MVALIAVLANFISEPLSPSENKYTRTMKTVNIPIPVRVLIAFLGSIK
jgi:hypothetical protein